MHLTSEYGMLQLVPREDAVKNLDLFQEGRKDDRFLLTVFCNEVSYCCDSPLQLGPSLLPIICFPLA